MAKGPGSEKSLQQRTAQIASKGTAREVYLKAISEDRRFGNAIRGDIHNRWGSATGQGVMRFILALLLMSGTAMAQVQNRTYQGLMSRNTGRSVTDSRGNITYYNSMGRNTGRSTTDSRGRTTYYDAMGRRPDDPPRTEETTTSDSFGRRTGHHPREQVMVWRLLAAHRALPRLRHRDRASSRRAIGTIPLKTSLARNFPEH